MKRGWLCSCPSSSYPQQCWPLRLMGDLGHQERMGYLGHQETPDPKATEDRREKEGNLALGFQGARAFLGPQLRVCQAHQGPQGLRAPQDLVDDVTQKIASIPCLMPVSGQVGNNTPEEDDSCHIS